MLDHLQTEARNPASSRLDELTSVEIVELMNAEDAKIADVVSVHKREIAQAIDTIADRLGRGGRLIYLGAGTSGRLGVLDASECPPTFQTDPSQVVGLIAGGERAMFRAVEGAEDSTEQGALDLKNLNLDNKDVVCGIASSGRTPYVIGGLKYARSIGAYAIGLVCASPSEISAEVDLLIAPVVGAEILTGSSRLKSGTATKMILNMLTTGAMVKLGKTFGNLMVDMKASNKKLIARSYRIVRMVTGLDTTAAEQLLDQCQGEVKTAIVSHLARVSPVEARQKLKEAGGRVRLAVGWDGKIATPVERSFRSDLVIGIDGGGTGTRSLLARADTGEILGRGEAGPSNIQSVGVENALRGLDDAIDAAFRMANLPRSRVATICLGLAGVDRQEGLDIIHGWVARSSVAEKAQVANDATLLLAAGTPEGWGLAVIAGTGSIAFVKKADGTIGRCGGWGYTLGDEGSAYYVTLRALRASCKAHDGVGKPTVLLDRFVKRMNLKEPPDLIPAVYRGPWDRAAIAGMAKLVLDAAAEGDTVAADIVRSEAHELALTAAAAVKNIGLGLEGLPIALAGGLVVNSEMFRDAFLNSLREQGITPGKVTPVEEPALGAVKLAQRMIAQ